ncbi:MAG: SIMPL domain-containing protein [Rivularia sp. T60_A2020_040]|nr:SIMPL domain-containing protein [Rivularia sp. T60_A2020_040]
MDTAKTFGYKSQVYKNLSNICKILPMVLFVSVASIQPGLTEEKIMLRTLTVTGQGLETIPTTLSQVSLGVQVQGKTANVVQQEAARKSNAVVNLLKSENVEKLETTGIQLNPVYSYKDNVRQTQGYEAINTVSFRITTEKAGKLLDEVIKAGATQINSVRFVATEQAITQAREQALKEATQDAQKQANAVFSSLGFTPKEVVHIQVGNASTPEPIMYRNAVPTAAMAEAAPTPIVGGEQEVGASVTLRISY